MLCAYKCKCHGVFEADVESDDEIVYCPVCASNGIHDCKVERVYYDAESWIIANVFHNDLDDYNQSKEMCNIMCDNIL